MLQHRLASKEALDGNTQALDRGHGEGADDGADGEVDEDVALAVTGGEVEDQQQAESQEDCSISQETCSRERRTQNSSSGHRERFALPGPERESVAGCVPGSFSLEVISSRVVTSSSSGACMTITVLPTRLSRQPSFPSRLSRSPSKYEDRMALHGTDKHQLVLCIP